MTMEVFTGKEEAVHIVHMAVNHVAGAIGMREVIGEGIEIDSGAEFEDGV